ncbi:protein STRICTOSIDINE SYNTHASE-LIKE 2 [Jatropha curcas]|uniref:protein STRICTOSIDINE SYNTHASE-LIKE 2 n=1 Tax=Jatropha curcas TaxID=180498 RepID=UPI0005FADF2D|nr:protein STRICTOSIDINE SYNTHASE-LIKE 2 [Jatropha curcas]
MAITSKIFFITTTVTVLISTLIAINRSTKLSYQPSNNNNNNIKFSFSDHDNLKQQESETLCLGGATGPESFAFDKFGRGAYTGVSDGRILKWEENEQRWIDFAVTSYHRIGCEEPCNRYEMEPICGRPLGLWLNESNGELYIADAYMGLLKVGSEGGLATKIVSCADKVPFNFTNNLDVDQSSGAVYFTDSSSRYQRRDYIYVILSGDKSGRLLKYDLQSKQVKVLIGNLSFPNGVVISKDGNSILFAETTTCRILKYWIKTPKIGTLEVFAELPGFPDNIKKSPRGGYWVAINSKREKILEWTILNPWIGNSLIKLPLDLMKAYSILGKYRKSSCMAIRLSEDGDILEVFEDRKRFKSLSEVNEKDGKLWIGSIDLPFVGRYDI